MPLYEYQCESCSERIEVIQKFSDPPLTHCTNCGGEVSKLLSAPAIQFKGSGWYITDYARNNGSSSNDSGNGAKGEAGNEGNSKSTESGSPAEGKSKSDSSESNTSKESKSAS